MRSLLLVPIWFVLALLIPTVWSIAHIYRRACGVHPVICPETGLISTIGLDTTHAVTMRMLGNPVQRIQQCSRWPERQTCDRRCLRQFEHAV